MTDSASAPSPSTPYQQWLDARPADSDAGWQHWSATLLSQFWSEVVVETLYSADDVLLHYAVFEHPQSKGWVIISPGRIETYLKYQELMLELAAQGYSVATLDHRGQGFSDRLSEHPQHGHVTQFDEFVRDFSDFILALKPRIGEQSCQLLAHSMGSAIACLYMAHYPHPFSSAVLSAPMMGVHTRPWPQSVAHWLIRIGHWFNKQLFGDRPRYFIGMRDYADVPFTDNELTHSENRYNWFRAMYQQHEEIQLGGPTVQWLMQSLQAMAELPEAARLIRVPVLVLQAELDPIVSPQPQRVFVGMSAHPATRLEVINGSYHEILMETDSIRGPALATALQFLREHQFAEPLEQSFSAPRRPKRAQRRV
ncbi:alpha/beta fold hydrolase [Aliidiomarina soli]|uniref:Lysophospholipase n=1 Tax=Aliidiomarina soli TaxID=1928574 RepID=A0A432WF67_9GAMM|nr:alpha/beta fold hydrolase [Aliidiomarina soli]RUO32401.1 lysophospholipase [Aliidiomarina soli]